MFPARKDLLPVLVGAEKGFRILYPPADEASDLITQRN